LFGLVTNTSRVRGVIAARTPSSGNSKSPRGETFTTAPPHARAVIAYMSNAGLMTMNSGLEPSSGRRSSARSST
jgi:hypothetical protein